MVIPVGGFGVPLQGPVPPELAPRFKIIKLCVCGMIVSLIAKLVAYLIVGMSALNVLLSSLNVVINVVIGIFLMNEDDHFKPVYRFMINTCCQQCQDQCQGGLSCLMSFVICNLITVVLDVLVNAALLTAVRGISMILSPAAWDNPIAGIFWTIHTAALILSLVSQSIGAWQGWQAYVAARDGGEMSSPVGGDWAAEQQQRPGGRRRDEDAPAASGWGGFGGGGNTLASSAPRQEFQAFQGQGQRLGGD